MTNQNDIDKQMSVFDQFSDPEPPGAVLQRVKDSVQAELRRRRRVRITLRIGTAGAVAAAIVLMVWVGSLFWIGTTSGAEATLDLEQAVQQFISAADNSQLTAATSELDERISELEEMFAVYGPQGSGWELPEIGIDRWESDLAELADSV